MGSEALRVLTPGPTATPAGGRGIKALTCKNSGENIPTSLQTDKKCYFWGWGDMQDLANTHTHTRNGENKRLKDESQKHTKKH